MSAVYPGPQPGDPPEWGWRELSFRVGAQVVVLPCALCGRKLGEHTSTAFYNVATGDLGRQIVAGWHDRCAERESLKAGMAWPRERDGAWGDLLRAVAKRGPGRLGPGLTGQERAALAGAA